MSRPLPLPRRRPRRRFRRRLHQTLQNLIVAVRQVAVNLTHKGSVRFAPRPPPRQCALHALHVGDVAAQELAKFGVGSVLFRAKFTGLKIAIH